MKLINIPGGNRGDKGQDPAPKKNKEKEGYLFYLKTQKRGNPYFQLNPGQIRVAEFNFYKIQKSYFS